MSGIEEKKRLEVLVIQYNLQDAEVIKYMLNAAGGDRYAVTVSRGVGGGIGLMKKKEFDVVLLDLEFSDRGADNPIRSLRSGFPRVPVIVLAHAASEQRAVRTLHAGARDYLIKDRLTPDLLVRAINWAVEHNIVLDENTALRNDLERLKEEISQVPYRDAVTGLPDGRLLADKLAAECDRADRQRKKTALLALKLEGFRDVGEPSSETGKRTAREAASRLKSLVRKSDSVLRTGPDRFAIVLADIIRPLQVAEIARTIGEAFISRFPTGELELHGAARIGISIYPDDGRDIGTILKRADEALLGSIEFGNCYRFFDSSLTAEAFERDRLKDQLGRSIQSGEMVIYYQPLVDISSRRIVCAEALARWRHPERGLLSPGAFIAAAEEAGLIGAIDDWVLHEALGQAKSWLEAGLSPVCVTVNISERQLLDPDLVGTVRTALEQTGVPAWSVYFEVSERAAMGDIERTGARLRELADLGVRISIDDFGTGYSSLDHLERLPVERIKIDKSFVRRVPADPDKRTIVRSITSLAHNMRIKVVAEGVETEDQLTFVRSTGCDEMQGYLFSKPLPAAEFTELLAAR